MKSKFLFLLFVSQLNFAQIWVNSLQDAQKIAKTVNKFILLDFNATWCKPCRAMETEYWYNSKYKSTLDKYVIVSIDIDKNKLLAQQYNVTSLPNVKLIDITGDVIYETLGYSSAKIFDEQFLEFPDNSEDLYSHLNFKDKNNPTDEELLNLATSYQVLLQRSKGDAKIIFSKLSNSFFNKCQRKTSDENYKQSSELGKFFNLALTDSGNKVIKNLNILRFSDHNKAYAHYILAKAFYQEKNKTEAEKNILEIEKLNDKDWLSTAKVLQSKYNK